MPKQASASVDDLPDVLLSIILELAGQEEGRSITLVSHRWRDAFFAAPGLWESFALAPRRGFDPGRGLLPRESSAAWGQWFAAKHAVLARVAARVQRFQAGAPWDSGHQTYYAGIHCQPRWRVGQFLALLRPGVLREARLLWQLSASDLAELPRLADGLQILQLEAADHIASAGVPPTLHQLHALRSLCYDEADPTEAQMHSMAALTQLTSLHLMLFYPLSSGWQEDAWDALGEDDQMHGGEVLPALQALAQLSQLQELQIKHRPALYRGEREEILRPLKGTLAAPPPSAFAALRSYLLQFNEGDVYEWDFKVGGARFVLVDCKPVQPVESPPPSPTAAAAAPAAAAASLTIGGLSSMQSLPRLLEALLPAGMPLFMLHVSDASPGAFQPASLGRCSALARLDTLRLAHFAVEEAALAALLQQAPRLKELVLDACLRLPGQLPRCLLQKRGLERLVLADNRLQGPLPPGPYLQDLVRLAVNDEQQQPSVPAALTATTSLQRLELFYGANKRPLVLTHGGVELLGALPALRVLLVDGIDADEETREELDELCAARGIVVELPDQYSPAASASDASEASSDAAYGAASDAASDDTSGASQSDSEEEG